MKSFRRYPLRDTKHYVLSLFMLGLAFGLRLYHLDFQSIWWDEGHSLFVASQPIYQIPTLPAMDVHPPAYFTLLHLWMNIAGQSEFALRYLSLIFSLLTVALIWRFAASISCLITRFTWPVILASLFAALSPLYVAYAQEVRSYAMITFLTLASTYKLWRILFVSSVDERQLRFGKAAGNRRSAVILYILLTTACLYTHYFTIFLLLFHNLAWLVWSLLPNKTKDLTGYQRERRAQGPTLQRRSRLGIWLISQVGILLLFTPQLLLALRQVTSYTNPNLTPPSLGEFISRSWQAYTISLTIAPDPARWGMIAIAGVLIIAVLSRILPGACPERILSNFLFLFGWFIFPLIAYFFVLQRQPSFEPRYMILVTPALFLFLAFGLTPLTQNAHVRRIRHPLYALAILPVVVFIVGLYNYFTNEAFFKDDSAGVANWLAAETTADDIVYVDVPHPFHYYTAKGFIAAPTRYLFVDIHTAAATLTHEAAGRNRLFWVTWRGSDTDPRGVMPFLAQKYGQQLGQRAFRGYDVTWFSLPDAGTEFSLPNDLTSINATFGDVLRLDGAAYGGYPPSSKATSINHPAWVTLHFTLLHDTNVDYRVSVRLRGADGRFAPQTDKDLLNDRHFRTSAWPLTDPMLDQAINVYTISLAPDTPPGPYRLEVVVYNAQPPYPSEGVTGVKSDDGAAAVIGDLMVTPGSVPEFR